MTGKLSRGYTVQKLEGIRKSHRGWPETWVQPRPVLAVLVPLLVVIKVAGWQAGKDQSSKVNGSLSKGGARLTVEEGGCVCGHSGAGSANGPGSLAVLADLAGRSWAWFPSFVASPAPQQLWTGHRKCANLIGRQTLLHRNLKGIGSLHSCYIRRAPLSAAPPTLSTRPLEAVISHPFLSEHPKLPNVSSPRPSPVPPPS